MTDTVTWVIIAYRQYGQWYSTSPFPSRLKAERHADLYLRDPKKDYVKDVTFINVELPR